MSRGGDLTAFFIMDSKAFRKEMIGIGEKIEAEVTEKVVGAVTSAYQRMLMRSPVWTGSYILSHRITLNLDVAAPPIFRVIDDQQKTAGMNHTAGAAAALGELGALSSFKLGDTIKISNSVPHAALVELGTLTEPAGGQYAQLQHELNEAGR